MIKTKALFKCYKCGYSKWKSLDCELPNQLPLNAAAVSATITTGMGFSTMQEFCAGFLSCNMTDKTYKRYRSQLVAKFEAAAIEEMHQAAEEEKRLAKEAGDVITVDGIEYPHVTVVVDGSWLKRSYKRSKYDSLSGCAVIIGIRTRKVLFIGVRNKFCSICQLAHRKKIETPNHICYKNWGRWESSGAMEKDIIVEGFKCSLAIHGLIYKTFVGDGDSSVHASILHNHPYRKQKITVEKIECKNHLFRNFSRKIEEASALRCTGVRRGNVLSFRNKIKRTAFTFRKDIDVLIERQNEQNINIDEKSENLRKDINNLINHVYGNHRNCKKNNIPCNVQSKKQNEKTKRRTYYSTLIMNGMFNLIQNAVHYLADHSKSLLYGLTSNDAESFHAIVAKYIGGKRINFGCTDSYYVRCLAAVVQFNTLSVHTKLSIHNNMKPLQSAVTLETRRKIKVHQNFLRRQEQGRKKRCFANGDDADYGPNCKKPDMSDEQFAEKKGELFDKLQDKQSRREEIQKNTIGQSLNSQWFNEKEDLLTASNFGAVCRRQATTLSANLVKKILYPTHTQVYSLEYGSQQESAGLKYLSRV